MSQEIETNSGAEWPQPAIENPPTEGTFDMEGSAETARAILRGDLLGSTGSPVPALYTGDQSEPESFGKEAHSRLSEALKNLREAGVSGVAAHRLGAGAFLGGGWLSLTKLTPERLAKSLDSFLQTIEETEGLAEDAAPAVLTFALAVLGLAKIRTLVFTAQEIELSGEEANTNLAVTSHANYPGRDDVPEFCKQLELSFADILYKRHAPEETITP